jgi:hypothetical protein
MKGFNLSRFRNFVSQLGTHNTHSRLMKWSICCCMSNWNSRRLLETYMNPSTRLTTIMAGYVLSVCGYKEAANTVYNYLAAVDILIYREAYYVIICSKSSLTLGTRWIHVLAFISWSHERLEPIMIFELQPADACSSSFTSNCRMISSSWLQLAWNNISLSFNWSLAEDQSSHVCDVQY